MKVETVLVTGASSGIGRELAGCFAADGSRLILLARKRHVLQELADELRKAHKTRSEVVQADLSQPGTPARIFEYLQANGTRVDALVNNAGFGALGQFAELPLEDDFAAKLWHTFHAPAAAQPAFEISVTKPL